MGKIIISCLGLVLFLKESSQAEHIASPSPFAPGATAASRHAELPRQFALPNNGGKRLSGRLEVPGVSPRPNPRHEPDSGHDVARVRTNNA